MVQEVLGLGYCRNVRLALELGGKIQPSFQWNLRTTYNTVVIVCE